jgi:hypothetical protein
MPIIEDADLTSVSTTSEPLPEAEYEATITEVEYRTDNPAKPVVIVKSRIDGGDQNGRVVWDWMHMKQNDGKPNEVAKRQLKRYFEAVLGEEAANVSRPNTDDLINARVGLFLELEEYTPKASEKNPNPKPQSRNNVKRIFAI